MTSPPKLNHVVFVVARERFDAVTDYLGGLGFDLQEAELTELGLTVRLDMAKGFEVIAPIPGSPSEPGSAAEYLARHGDGLFTVVVRVADCTAAEHIANQYGVQCDFRQEFAGDGFEFKEVKLEPLHGVPITLMQTNVPMG
jgi:4-hydroxyphenylpyruvate dioxygenase-like putative hemolysin